MIRREPFDWARDWGARVDLSGPSGLRSRLEPYSVAGPLVSDSLVETVRMADLLGEDPVRAWRRGQLLAAGCDSLLAELVADSRVDVHEFVRLTGAGCAPALAWEILR